jgi:hypothetical protein
MEVLCLVLSVGGGYVDIIYVGMDKFFVDGGVYHAYVETKV